MNSSWVEKRKRKVTAKKVTKKIKSRSGEENKKTPSLHRYWGLFLVRTLD